MPKYEPREHIIDAELVSGNLDAWKQVLGFPRQEIEVKKELEYSDGAGTASDEIELKREAIARKIADWMDYSWEGLPDYSITERGYYEWGPNRIYQGGKPDLLRLADELMR